MPARKNSPTASIAAQIAALCRARRARIRNRPPPAGPRELVFRAWTDPAMMAEWWGPHGFTNPVCRLDVRPGGAWYIGMRRPTASFTRAREPIARWRRPSES